MNKDLIESKGLPYSPNLTMIPTQKNCIYPTKEQVFNLFAKYYLFATLATTDYDLEYFNFIYRNLNTMYNFESFFSGKDKELLNKLLNKDLSLNLSKISWLYEDCFIFAWIMNLTNFPSQNSENNAEILNALLFMQFDEVNKKNLPSKMFDFLYNKESNKLDYEKINLKSFDEILDKADLVKRYLWGLEELRINNKQNTSGLNETVLRYQLHGFSRVLRWDLTKPGI
ncbi:MAG: DUF4272 domain-containing protein [Clostridia bacterium]|nr:DUF4272 domain-containing protein [Clostridia bacterium]